MDHRSKPQKSAMSSTAPVLGTATVTSIEDVQGRADSRQIPIPPSFSKMGGAVPYEQIRLTLAHAYGRAEA